MCERGGWGAGNARPEKSLLRKGFLGALKYSLFADRLTSATELCDGHQPQGEEVQNGKSLARRKSTANVLNKGQMKWKLGMVAYAHTTQHSGDRNGRPVQST